MLRAVLYSIWERALHYSTVALILNGQWSILETGSLAEEHTGLTSLPANVAAIILLPSSPSSGSPGQDEL